MGLDQNSVLVILLVHNSFSLNELLKLKNCWMNTWKEPRVAGQGSDEHLHSLCHVAV